MSEVNLYLVDYVSVVTLYGDIGRLCECGDPVRRYRVTM